MLEQTVAVDLGLWAPAATCLNLLVFYWWLITIIHLRICLICAVEREQKR